MGKAEEKKHPISMKVEFFVWKGFSKIIFISFKEKRKHIEIEN